MKFIDYAEIQVTSGKGGDGAVAFRREKFVPKGGPAGGNGGKGGDVKFTANPNLNTLMDFKYKNKYKAGSGENGGGSLKDGKSAKDLIIQVPVGTIIKDARSGRILCDLDEPGKEFVAAKGGKGGKGNSNFATSTNQAPRYAEEGQPGEEKKIILELKLIADVGLVGFPNAGKSTFISVVSAAKPKIADYPFTTLQPNLGIVDYKDHKSFTVADIPGIIEGAHEGRGLGLQFLRHIERTRILLILIDINAEDYQEQYDTIVSELENYSPVLAEKKRIVAISKADIVDQETLSELSGTKITGYGNKLFFFSSASKYGLSELLDYLWDMLKNE